MPRKMYSTIEDYDGDYQFTLRAETAGLPAGTLTFSGNDLSFDDPLPAVVKKGGWLRMSCGPAHPNSRSEIRITAVAVDRLSVTVGGRAFQSGSLRVPQDAIIYVRNDLKLRYLPRLLDQESRAYIQRIARTAGIPKSARVVVVGCGLGWEVAGMIDAGYTNVVGTDSSVWIQANKSLSCAARAREVLIANGYDPDDGVGVDLLAELTAPWSPVPNLILDEDLLTDGSRNSVGSVLGGDPEWSIAIGLLPVLDDAEVVNLDAEKAKAIANRVYFQAEVGGNNFNWKTKAEWEAMLPDAIIVTPATW